MMEILCFNLAGDRLAVLEGLCKMMKINLRQISPAEQGQTLGALCGLSAGKPGNPMLMPFREEMLIMSGLDDAVMDRFLALWRQKQSPIRLKAVVTPWNIGWTVHQLRAELMQEAERMEKKK